MVQVTFWFQKRGSMIVYGYINIERETAVIYVSDLVVWICHSHDTKYSHLFVVR